MTPRDQSSQAMRVQSPWTNRFASGSGSASLADRVFQVLTLALALALGVLAMISGSLREGLALISVAMACASSWFGPVALMRPTTLLAFGVLIWGILC